MSPDDLVAVRVRLLPWRPRWRTGDGRRTGVEVTGTRAMLARRRPLRAQRVA